MNDKVKKLVDEGICISFAQARRIVHSGRNIDDLIQKFKGDQKWGRKPRKIKKLVWPKENHAIGIV